MFFQALRFNSRIKRFPRAQYKLSLRPFYKYVLPMIIYTAILSWAELSFRSFLLKKYHLDFPFFIALGMFMVLQIATKSHSVILGSYNYSQRIIYEDTFKMELSLSSLVQWLHKTSGVAKHNTFVMHACLICKITYENCTLIYSPLHRQRVIMININ